MIFGATILLLASVAVNSQVPARDYHVRPYSDPYYGPPKPYAFNFDAVLDDGIGRIARTETADGSGRVQGSYSLANDEGHSRVVDYVADQDGFRAHVRTNEPGTDNQNPADVIIESSSPFANRAYSGRYPGTGPIVRRPVLNAAAGAAPEVPLVDPAPEAIQPVAPVYRGRQPARTPYRPPVRSPYTRY